MAIRFHCGSCSQPIEVDDEWALKAVACPYCRKTITAPAESTITDLSRVVVASPLGPARSDKIGTAYKDAVDEPPPHAAVDPLHHPNRIAAVSLGLGCGVMFQLILAGIIIAPHSLEMDSLQERIAALQQEDMGFLAAMQQAWMEYYQQHGGAPPAWMMVAALLEMGSGLMWIAAVVCAVIALRRPRRRRLAVSALVIAGVVPVFLCCGGFAL